MRNPELADNVSRLRHAVYPGVPLWKVASMAGMPPSQWTELEKGRANPTLATLVKVSAVLGVEVGDLTKDSAKVIEEHAGRVHDEHA